MDILGQSPGPIAISSNHWLQHPTHADVLRAGRSFEYHTSVIAATEKRPGTAWKCLEMLRVGLKPQL